VVTPDSEPEEFDGAYSYVDLVKNRHLLGGQSVPAVNCGGDAGPPSVYTPLSFSARVGGGEGPSDEGGGVYMSPEAVDPIHEAETGEPRGETPVVMSAGMEREPLYMVPGDHVYDDSMHEAYAPLTDMTKLEVVYPRLL
jgi:hypothetical protein